MDEELHIPHLGRKGDRSPKDSFFENFISICRESEYDDSILDNDPLVYEGVVNDYFTWFLKGCLWHFTKGRNDDLTDTFNYFKYIRNRFLHLKGTLFSEKDGEIKHIRSPKDLRKENIDKTKSINHIYKLINEGLSVLDDYIIQLSPRERNQTEEAVGPRLRKIRIHGFRIKNKDVLETSFDRLKYNGLINQDAKFSDFERAFTDWLSENKITWLGGPGLLSYFIKAINGKGIEDEKKSIWTTTTNCFQDKDSKDFNVEQLRFAKKPTKTDDVDLVIKSINKYFEA